MPITMNAEHIR